MNLSDYTDEELKEELVRRLPLENVFSTQISDFQVNEGIGHRWAKAPTKFWKGSYQGHPYCFQCMGCGEFMDVYSRGSGSTCPKDKNLLPERWWYGSCGTWSNNEEDLKKEWGVDSVVFNGDYTGPNRHEWVGAMSTLYCGHTYACSKCGYDSCGAKDSRGIRECLGSREAYLADLKSRSQPAWNADHYYPKAKERKKFSKGQRIIKFTEPPEGEFSPYKHEMERIPGGKAIIESVDYHEGSSHAYSVHFYDKHGSYRSNCFANPKDIAEVE